MNQTKTHILILEDNPSDAELVKRELRKAGLDFSAHWAPDKGSFVQALNQFVPDLVLADYSLPGFDGLAAMAMARQLFEDIPVIIVSGAIGEETAIEALKAGATDYVLKQRLGRLGPAVYRAIAETREIQEKKSIAEALRLSEERFRTTFENAAVGIEQVALDGRLLEVNPALCAMLGYTREELLARTFIEITHPEDHPRELPLIEQLFSGEIPSYQVEKRYICKQGRPLWVRVTSSLAQGSRSYRVSVIEDITARKAAQEELRQSEARFRGTFENAAIGLSHIDLNGQWLLVNQPLCQMLGYMREELQRKPFWDLTHPDDVMLDVPLYARLIRGEIDHYDVVKRYLHKDGHILWIHVTRSLQRDEAGLPLYTINSVLDITKQKQVEETARQSEAHLQRVLDSVFTFMGVMTPEGVLTYINRSTLEVSGLRSEEVLGKLLSEIRWWSHSPEVKAQIQDAIIRVRQGRTVRFDTTALVDGGRLISIDFALTPMRDEQGLVTHLIPSAVDITGRKQMEQALRQSEAQFRQLADAMPQLVWITRPDGHHEYFNKLWYDFTGATPEESQGEMWSRLLHPDDISRTLERWHHSLRTGEPYEIEYRFRRASDGSYRWFLGRALPVRDERGAILRWFGTCTEIHDQKMAQDALRDADRRKDEFLAMLAHELRNPLAPIRYAVQMLNIAGTQHPHLQKQRDVIDRQVSHMSRLLDDLLDVSRITRGKIKLRKERLDLRLVAEQVLESMRSLAQDRQLQLSFHAPSAPVAVECDPTRLEQILRNLLQNAIKYTESGGCIGLMVEVDAGGGTHWQSVIRVRDSGIGIGPEVLPRVFDLFAQADQTLDRAQGGLGIGLTMVKRLVELHGGRVEARSEGLGRGSEFVVHLPLADAVILGHPEAAGSPHPAAAAPPVLARRVLVVDDNEDSATSLGELLGLWGHEVRTAHDGPHALAAAQEWQPEVILLDIGLPGMDGYEVARRLRQKPESAAIWMVAVTGYGAEEDRRRAQEAGFDHHLVKPVSLEELSRLLARPAAA